MKIVILRSAVEDLARGRGFYDLQGEGLGDYFEESLATDIDSLRLYAGVHVMAHGYHRMLSDRFPYAIYYEVAEGWYAYEPFSTVVVIRRGFAHVYGKHRPTTASNATVESRRLRRPSTAVHVGRSKQIMIERQP